MNYDEAREIEGNGWHWTTMNDGRIRTAAPCVRYTGDPDLPLGRPTKDEDFERCEPHATKEEAERHFYDYSVENARERQTDRWMDCAVCDGPTKRLFGTAGMGLLFSGGVPFCDEHFSKDALRELLPFTAGIRLMHS